MITFEITVNFRAEKLLMDLGAFEILVKEMIKNENVVWIKKHKDSPANFTTAHKYPNKAPYSIVENYINGKRHITVSPALPNGGIPSFLDIVQIEILVDSKAMISDLFTAEELIGKIQARRLTEIPATWREVQVAK